MQDSSGIRHIGNFYDDRFYPLGFKRSGDFTLKESDLLQQYGKTLQALQKGELKADSKEEKRFVSVCQQKETATTAIERAWMKYCHLIEIKANPKLYCKQHIA